jgi:hypothetical protein
MNPMTALTTPLTAYPARARACTAVELREERAAFFTEGLMWPD